MQDRLQAMQIFMRVAELQSFTQASVSLGLSKTHVSNVVAQFETFLGARLLQRTTRTVRLTQDGQSCYERCKSLLAEFQELESLFQLQAEQVSGRLRVDMSTGIARNLVLPKLAEFIEQYPHIELELSSTDRKVDVIAEGFDCVIRVGSVQQEGLIAKKLGHFKMLNCVSPAYIAQYGKPESLEALTLHNHKLVHYVSQLGGTDSGFEYQDPHTHQGNLTIQLPQLITVNNADAYSSACLAGLGIIQVPSIGVAKYLNTGELVEILKNYPAPPMPVSLLYPHRRHLSKRLQVFMAWLNQQMTPFLVPH
ncbi:LysR family transcriptional regulator [Shewanella baltica]|uniref:LysR family transcriptional regulator n=1 Tax=Shewanella baltica TaxID=62322 RepID=UPI00217E8796|nr:LysR family transcriptional regulator [Shewanella baltica]MCS6155149.1 LysR family transcriptional regulator [Shewanella baltica]MCS6241103.1 LysR family transcriptional regulator [Shewanella baltica]